MEPVWKKILKYIFFICAAIALISWAFIIVLLFTDYSSPMFEPLMKVAYYVGGISGLAVIINGFIYDYKRRKQRKAELKKSE